MSIGDIPIIRLEVEGMRYAILRALEDRADAISAETNRAINNFITTFDWQAEVARLLEPMMREAIKAAMQNHFIYGDGRKAIDDAVREALTGKAKP